MKKHFLVILILVVVCAPAMAANQFVQWGSTPVLTQTDSNPYVISSVSLFTLDGRPFAAWSSQMGQFLAVPSNFKGEFKCIPNGLDPNAITRIALTLDDGETWIEAKRFKGLGWVVEMELTNMPIGRVITPQWAIEGKFRGNKLQVLLFVFRWESQMSNFGAFQMIIKETPEYYKQLGDRRDMFEYSRAVEGSIPTFVDEPRVEWENPASMTIQLLNTQVATFLVRNDDKTKKVSINGNKMSGELGNWNLPKPCEVTWKNLNPGDKYQVGMEENTMSTAEIKKGCQTLVSLQKLADVVSPKYRGRINEWNVLCGDPRYQQFVGYLGHIDNPEQGAMYFQTKYAAQDYNRLDYTQEEIEDLVRCAKENGVEELIIKNGEILNSGLTFGKLSRIFRGPIRINWVNASWAICYTPKGYKGNKRPYIVGRAFTEDGKEFPGCVNMFSKSTTKEKWICSVDYIPGKCKVSTMQQPNQPVGYTSPERPQYTVTQVQIAQFMVEFIQDINLNIEFNPKIDVIVLNDIFNNIDITNTINTTISNNIINQIMNILNNANANNNA